MPRPKKIAKTTAELLQESRILEENGGIWLVEHVAVAAGRVGRRRHQGHAQAFARQQQRQRAAHDAGTADAYVV